MEELDKYFNGELDPKILYASREQGTKAFAEEYSFNIESELYNQLTKEQQVLWRKEIEQAVISGGEVGIELANDKRYDKEEPVSEDLEEAAHKYADGENPTCPCEKCLIKVFKAGAEWKEKKDQETIETAIHHAYHNGRLEMKEQMMAKGVDGVVHHFEKCGVASVHYKDPTGVPMSYFISPKGFVVGDKVKVIVIKED